MPWPGVSLVDVRFELVQAYQSGLWSMSELCDEVGVSRKTAYKWVARYAAGGVAGLTDQSRRPQTHPRATDPALVARLIEARRQHPTWSARKLLRVLRVREPHLAWPSRSTGCDLLAKHGLVRRRPRGRRVRVPVEPLAPITTANEVWTTDFKGEFRTRDGVYCYPLTLRDGRSRFVLRCDALESRRTEPTRRRFERAFAEYGLPQRIRSDNGGPFAAPGLTRLSRLSVWWVRLGILPERIAPGRPEQNGSHEQFHRVLKAETARPPAANRRAQQVRFQRFCTEYNFERPHEALGDRPPASCYRPSPRALPARLPPVDYPGHMEIRRVASNGTMSWRNRTVHLTEVLAGEDLGWEEVDDGVWLIHFATVALARFDERTATLQAVGYGTR